MNSVRHLTRIYSIIEVMERHQAAEYLGVSVSTVDRLAAQGRLTKGRARRKTRPVTVFDESQVAELKKEIEASRQVKTTPSLKPPRKGDAIGFRLDPFYIERLMEAGKEAGQSPGEYARSLVIEALENDREERFRTEIKRLRENLAEVFYLILVNKMDSKRDQAEAIIDRLLGGG